MCTTAPPATPGPAPMAPPAPPAIDPAPSPLPPAAPAPSCSSCHAVAGIEQLAPPVTQVAMPVSMPSAPPAVDPSSVRDKAGTGGLTPASVRGLEVAHRFGLPLVSGKRSGGGGSDHDHGNAIDVGTLPIGAAGSTGATPAMRDFAEYMRAEGRAGRLDVKYIISDGRIASANGGWAWRPYTYPGRSASSLEALRSSNRGEYNRLQHYDHVHVSFG